MQMDSLRSDISTMFGGKRIEYEQVKESFDKRSFNPTIRKQSDNERLKKHLKRLKDNGDIKNDLTNTLSS